MKIKDLELVKTVVHNYLITTMTYSTLSLDLENIKQVVKISNPYELLVNRILNQLDDEIKAIRSEMNTLKINSDLPSRNIDSYFIEYLIVAKGEDYPVLYARAALRNQVSQKIKELLQL